VKWDAAWKIHQSQPKQEEEKTGLKTKIPRLPLLIKLFKCKGLYSRKTPNKAISLESKKRLKTIYI
jgi:hypothetical protein